MVELARRVFKVMSCPDFGPRGRAAARGRHPLLHRAQPAALPSPRRLADDRGAGCVGSRLQGRAAAGGPLGRPSVRHPAPSTAGRGAGERAAAQAVQRPSHCANSGVSVGRYQPGRAQRHHRRGGREGGPRHPHRGRRQDPGRRLAPPRFGPASPRCCPPRGTSTRSGWWPAASCSTASARWPGLTQVLEWGWLETPILLTNSLSVGRVHSGVVGHMVERHPDIGDRARRGPARRGRDRRLVPQRRAGRAQHTRRTRARPSRPPPAAPWSRARWAPARA